MSSPEYKAKEKEYQWRAAESRRQASETLKWGRERIGDFSMQGEELLSQGVVLLGKTGSLGERKATDPGFTGLDVGRKDSAEATSKIAELQKQLDELSPDQFTRSSGGRDGQTVTDTVAYEKAKQELTDKLTQYKSVETLGKTAGITGPEGMQFATGSDLATLASTRSLLERDRRRMIRAGQESALAMLEAGEMYDVQADYMADAGAWDAFSTVLDLIMGGFKTAASMGVF